MLEHNEVGGESLAWDEGRCVEAGSRVLTERRDKGSLRMQGTRQDDNLRPPTKHVCSLCGFL